MPVFEVRLLGPVEMVRAGREIALGGPKQRAVLALLLLEPGQVVPAGRLIEEVWLGYPPPGAAKTLRSYVSRLRGVLAPEAGLLARGGGYAISIDPGLIDAGRFERLVAAGQAALSQGERAAAGNRFREALALWRGRALADVADVEPLALEAARLEDLRLTALEGRIEADLALGLHAEVAGELESLITEHPLRERLWRLLVLALYRGERQADALAAYRRAREMLAGELGLEPGEELRRLEQAVLRQEVPAPPVAQHNLPASLTSFVDRQQALATLERLLGQARLVTLTGTGGAGKTRLAVEAAAAVLRRFPDGVWLADLASIADPGLVATQVMEALGVRQAGDIPVMEALRFRLRSADLLLVLDNCEHVVDACAKLAGELLRSSPALRVLATSREPLGVAGEVTYLVWPLDLRPDPADAQASAAPAVRLFFDRGSAARGGESAATVAPVAVAERICRKLDGLPLAIELAAARLGTLSAAEIETHLADRFRFLAYRRPAAHPRHQALQAAMDWSYELLPVQERRAFGELSVFAGTFSLEQAAAVCSGGDQAAALEVIDRLAAKSLVVAEPAEDGTRYRLLETVRQYAADRLAAAGGTEAARKRHAHAFLRLAEQEHELSVLSREHDNFRAALEWSLTAGDQIGPRLARELGAFWYARGLFQEGRDWLERALAQRPPDRKLRAALLRLLGTMLLEVGDFSGAEAALSDGLAVATAVGAPAERARIQVLLTDLHKIHTLPGGSSAGPLEECEAAIAVLQAEGDLEGLADAWILVGTLRFNRGEWPADQEAFERAIAYARQSGNHRAGMIARHWLGTTFLNLPIPADAAVERVEDLLREARREPWAEAGQLMALSLVYAYAGRIADARAAIVRSRAMFTRMGAKLPLAYGTLPAGAIELIAGDPAAAERYYREGYEAFHAMGSRGYRSHVAAMLAEALHAQGRLDEAHEMTEEARVANVLSDARVQVQWQSTRAKILAWRGQFVPARRLIAEAEALISSAAWALLKATVLTAGAEVDLLAGTPAQAAASLRAALRIYEDRHVILLAERVKAALASAAAHSGPEPG
jgi:predicted ATPase/DNA-binding SARP family transcriptional activator